MSGLRQRLERMLDGLFPKSQVAITPAMGVALRADPLRIIDIGGAMGPDARWAPLRPDLAWFMMFEPDARSQDGVVAASARGDVTLPCGLADRAGRRTLYLTEGPFASSLYPPNKAVLGSFATWPWYEPAGEVQVDVDTLDACLARTPGWRADFLKVDVEGADLDVLKGGGDALRGAFGVQVEMSILERNVGAPVMPEVDRWLRDKGFVPFAVLREHWIRANGIHGANSRAQLVWADAVYFRDLSWLQSTMRAAGEAEAAGLLSRAVALLLVYQAHDMAWDLIEGVRREPGISAALIEDLQAAVRGSVMGLLGFSLRGALALGAAGLLAVPLALAGRRGRVAARELVVAQAAPLFDALARASSRAGLARACIADR
jgi:FkbM family methyltransferase